VSSGVTGISERRQKVRKGFTLIELMIVIAIIAIIAAIAIPSLLRSQMSSNETACVGSLRTLVASQAQFKGASVVDQDSDGTGEYGFFAELAGSEAPRTDPRIAGAVPTDVRQGEFITQVLGNMDAASGTSAKSGYHFYMYLPDNAGATIGETSPLPAGDNTTANAQETRFVAYAWPVTFDSSGKRCFVVNQQGEVFTAKNTTALGVAFYSGIAGASAGPPLADAAFSNADLVAAADIAGAFPDIDAGETGVDTQLWVPAGQ
jgi:prepilin-type N-terminal cleavage/methylation domain-containing protein